MDINALSGFLIGILGIFLSIIFYLKGSKKKNPAFEISGINIISESIKNKVNDIKIIYKDTEIKSLTVTKVAIWNSGNDTIWEKDIPNSNKFRIDVSQINTIYESEIISKDKDSTLELHKIDNSIICNFNFLEANSGFIIKIIHSGINSDSICVMGKVIGGGEMKRINDFGRNSEKREKEFWKYIGIGFFSIFGYFSFISTMPLFLKIMVLFTCGLMMTIGITQIFQKKVPSRLKEKFYQN